MIPPDKRTAVTRGLHQAFGITEFEEIRELTDGPGWNPVFRMVVRGSPFLLRMNMRAGDLACHYSSMKTASEAGLAPRVWYSSVEDRISITDFVEAIPFPATEALVRMPAALRTLHALPPFPKRAHQFNTSCTFLLNKGPALDGFIQKVQAANILPEAAGKELFARYEQIASVYRYQEADMVSSHNDLFKPDNILFDGQRVWLVDWEAAFLNDRYADLAVVANLVVASDAEERGYLQEYFGHAPDGYQRARFFLMRQIAHLFYAMAFLLIGSSGKPIDWHEAVPELTELQRRMWTGEVRLMDNHVKTVYGKAHLEQLMQNVQQARFEEAVRIVSGRHASP